MRVARLLTRWASGSGRLAAASDPTGTTRRSQKAVVAAPIRQKVGTWLSRFGSRGYVIRNWRDRMWYGVPNKER